MWGCVGWGAGYSSSYFDPHTGWQLAGSSESGLLPCERSASATCRLPRRQLHHGNSRPARLFEATATTSGRTQAFIHKNMTGSARK